MATTRASSQVASVADACRRNVVFMVLSADTRPHSKTLAGFVSELNREIVGLFGDVLLYAWALPAANSRRCPRRSY
jgi:hypothetical protein